MSDSAFGRYCWKAEHKEARVAYSISWTEATSPKALPLHKISKNEIEAFCKALKKRFNDSESGFGKAYIKLLVDEIRIEKKQVVMSGSYGALAQAVSGTNSESPAASVPIFTTDWRARTDSNRRPPSS